MEEEKQRLREVVSDLNAAKKIRAKQRVDLNILKSQGADTGQMEQRIAATIRRVEELKQERKIAASEYSKLQSANRRNKKKPAN